VLPCPQLIFPSKTWFFGIYLNFQQQKSLKNQYLPHSESKSYQINSIKSCSSRSFQQHQRHTPIPLKNFSYDLIYFSVKMLWNPAHAPVLVESFPKIPRTWSKASQFGGSHNYKTKKTTFLHR
jgi:hypothetical protein